MCARWLFEIILQNGYYTNYSRSETGKQCEMLIFVNLFIFNAVMVNYSLTFAKSI